MRQLQVISTSLVVVCVAIGLGRWITGTDPRSTEAADAEKKAKATPEAVEEDDDEFMEYVFEEPFKRLKKGLASQPQDKAAWKEVKSDSLILAECANLLLLRNADGEELWDVASVAVRQDAGKLYAAAKKKDVAAAGTAFKSMITACNRCHDEFGGDELEP